MWTGPSSWSARSLMARLPKPWMPRLRAPSRVPWPGCPALPPSIPRARKTTLVSVPSSGRGSISILPPMTCAKLSPGFRGNFRRGSMKSPWSRPIPMPRPSSGSPLSAKRCRRRPSPGSPRTMSRRNCRQFPAWRRCSCSATRNPCYGSSWNLCGLPVSGCLSMMSPGRCGRPISTCPSAASSRTTSFCWCAPTHRSGNHPISRPSNSNPMCRWAVWPAPITDRPRRRATTC